MSTKHSGGILSYTHRWAFLEIDEHRIKDIKNAILAKIQSLSTAVAEKWLS